MRISHLATWAWSAFFALGMAVPIASAQVDFVRRTAYLDHALNRFFVAEDFDRDGDLDLVAIENPTGIIEFFENGGDGIFDVTRISQSTTGIPGHFTAGDFDGDGILDLVIADGAVPQRAVVLLGDGSGGFGNAYASFALAGIPAQLSAADMDGDGDADVAVVTQSPNKLTVYLNHAGTFTAGFSAPRTVFGEVKLGDLDGDGDIDIVAATSPVLEVLLNDGSGNLSPGFSTPMTTLSYLRELADIDGDGSLDLLLVREEFVGSRGPFYKELRVAYNLGPATFAPPQALALSYRATSLATSVAAADFDLDGRMDILWILQQNALALLQTRQGNFQEVTPTLDQQVALTTDLAVGDVDGDGDIDAVVLQNARNRNLVVYSNTHRGLVMEFQFNDAPGLRVANTAEGTTSGSDGFMDRPNWTGSPGRAGFGANDPGLGCLAQPSGAKMAVSFPSRVLGGFTIMWWQRIGTTPQPPGEERVVCDISGVGSTLISSYGTFAWKLPSSGIISSIPAPSVPGQWVHAALAFDDLQGTGQWYIDGVADPNPINLPPGTRVLRGDANIGGSFGAAPASLTYDIDDLRFYSYALDQNQIMRAMVKEEPRIATVAEACIGSGGATRFEAFGELRPGGRIGFNILPSLFDQVVFCAAGASIDSWGGIPLPLYLGGGCELAVSIDALFAPPDGKFDLRAPSDPAILESHLYLQPLVFHPQSAMLSTGRALDLNF